MTYTPPLKDMLFCLRHLAGVNDDMTEAILTEAARLSSEVWAKTNRVGDQDPPRLEDDAVRTPQAFKDAYAAFSEGGWGSLTAPEEFDGQNLPSALGMAVNEMWQSANLSLSLCPLLTHGAVETILHHGSQEQKQTYLPQMIAGTWTGTMLLTEPQAGSDLSAIRTVAKKNGDHYLITGQKIYITWGDHDMTPNIIHLVLAHIDGLPEGNNGLGLFIVPKFLVDEDGDLGARNDIKPVSLEHKLGIHGSPTCVMSCGDDTGAIGYLLGEEGHGLRNMFTMMNNARLGVGLQGVALSERSYQQAVAYARERVQSPALSDPKGPRVEIINHPDVRRMLMVMRASTQASRALTYYAGGMIDKMNAGDQDAAVRVDLLTPLVKAWSTDLAVENGSLGVQVHGGMGYVEETGAAQYYRDARILPIYEGTNGIQALDLLFRKTIRDKGTSAKAFIAEMKGMDTALDKAGEDVLQSIDWILGTAEKDPEGVAVSAAAYLRQFSILAGGYMMARLSHAVNDDQGDPAFSAAKQYTAQFYLQAVLPEIYGLSAQIRGGSHGALSFKTDDF